MGLWDEPNVELRAKVFLSFQTAFMTLKVKNNHAHATTKALDRLVISLVP
jgi:hypothetical protein